MENAAPILAVAGVIAFIGGLVWLVWFIDKKRTESMSAWAQAHGFVFEGERPALIDELARFKLFNQGHKRKVKNLLRGAKDTGAVRIADYQYTTGRGKHQTVWQQTICILTSPGRRAPHFFVRRQQRLFDALGKVFGGQDINFDDDPKFSKAYVLQTAGDEQQLRHFMSPGLREALTRLADKNLVLEVEGDTMLLHRGRRLKAEQLDELVTDAINLRRHWS